MPVVTRMIIIATAGAVPDTSGEAESKEEKDCGNGAENFHGLYLVMVANRNNAWLVARKLTYRKALPNTGRSVVG
jgi:hypothetical protein